MIISLPHSVPSQESPQSYLPKGNVSPSPSPHPTTPQVHCVVNTQPHFCPGVKNLAASSPVAMADSCWVTPHLPRGLPCRRLQVQMLGLGAEAPDELTGDLGPALLPSPDRPPSLLSHSPHLQGGAPQLFGVRCGEQAWGWTAGGICSGVIETQTPPLKGRAESCRDPTLKSSISPHPQPKPLPHPPTASRGQEGEGRGRGSGM